MCDSPSVVKSAITPPYLCVLFLFLVLLLLLDCRLLVLVLSPHEVEGGGESTTSEGEVVF